MNLQPDFYQYLRHFFENNSQLGVMNFTTFTQWPDIVELLRDEKVDITVLPTIWTESVKISSDGGVEANVENYVVTFDKFVRMVTRVNEIIEEAVEANQLLDSLRTFE